MAVSLLILIWQVWQKRAGTLDRGLALGAGLVYALQIGIGALYVLSVASAEWGAIHVGLAATVWGLLVALTIIEYLEQSS